MRQIKKLDPTATGIAFSILAAVFVLFMLYPTIKTYAALTSEIASAEALINFKEACAAQTDMYTKETDILSADFEKKIIMLPSFEQLTEKIVYINTLMEDCNISEMEFIINGPSEVETLNGLFRISVKLRGLGRYDDTMNFIQLLNETDTLYIIEEMSINSSGISNIDNVELYAYVSLYVVKRDTAQPEPEGKYYDR